MTDLMMTTTVCYILTYFETPVAKVLARDCLAAVAGRGATALRKALLKTRRDDMVR